MTSPMEVRKSIQEGILKTVREKVEVDRDKLAATFAVETHWRKATIFSIINDLVLADYLQESSAGTILKGPKLAPKTMLSELEPEEVRDEIRERKIKKEFNAVVGAIQHEGSH